MNYEIDFIGIKEHTKDASAVCLRWYNEHAGRYIVVVYDGGFKVHGETLVKHLKSYYFAEESDPTIDIVFCSHSDDDHASGLVRIHFVMMFRLPQKTRLLLWCLAIWFRRNFS